MQRKSSLGWWHRIAPCLGIQTAIASIILSFSAYGAGVVTNATEAAFVSALAGGGTVTFACDGTITLTSTKTITNSTVLDATGHAIMLSGGNNVELFYLTSGPVLTLSNLTLANGKQTVPNQGPYVSGGAIYGGGSVVAYNSIFSNNVAIGTNGTAGANSGSGNGGAGTDGGTALGGAINLRGGVVRATGCRFVNNQAQGGQGGAGGNGGGDGSGGNGGAGGVASGGAIGNAYVYVTNCTFFNNWSIGGNGGQGGNYGSSHTGNAGIGGAGNRGIGGAIVNSGECISINCAYYYNVAVGGNAGNSGIGNTSSSTHGADGGEGSGGAAFMGYLSIWVNCTFFSNAVAGGNGGSIVSGSGIGGNGVSGNGGGFYLTDSGAASYAWVTNCTFSSCSAFGGVGGVGAVNGTNGLALGGNARKYATNHGGTFMLKNCILAYAPSGGNGSGTFVDYGQNISSDNSITLNGTGSHVNTDPVMGVLGMNGGPTATCALHAGSPAIDAADNASAPIYDQRNYSRFGAADIGAYEYNGSPYHYAFVSIQAVDGFAAEAGTNTAVFSVTRTGSASQSLSIGLDISGTAVAGNDYTALPTNIVLAAGVIQSNLVVVPLQSTNIEPMETIVVGLKPGTNYFLGLYTNAVVTIDGEMATARSTYPTGERYLRGTGTNLDFYTIVIPLNGLKGTRRDDVETNGLATLYHYNGAVGGNQTTTNNRIACNTPVASFGAHWGTPLRTGRSYTVRVNYDPVQIIVLNRTNGVQAGVMSIPSPFDDWEAFAANGFATNVTGYGLTTTLRLDLDFNLTHTATDSATNYIFLVTGGGLFNDQNIWLNGAGQSTNGYLYDLTFDARPTLRSVFLEQPHFNGQPLPPDLLNKTPEELLNFGAMVTNAVSLTPSTCTNLDQSPELRRHPILDQFVADLNNDPIALVNYVQNEIELTDAIAYRSDGQVQSESVNQGGVNRGALGVYLEGQGSPMEQCALLIYLLRQAGYPAAYVFPPDGGLKMLDSRLSSLLRMQLVGAQDDQGHFFTTNRLITVNYPWVAAYINGQWVHLFPWLKDTQVIEGLDLYDYLPPQYKDLQLWVKDYVTGNTNLMAFATPDDDTPTTIFPAYLKSYLLTNAPGISLDDIGMRYVNRRHLYATWSDFPRPTWVTNASTAVESLTSPDIVNVSPLLTNVFDTVSIELYSLQNPQKDIQTGDMRMCDLHNRKFFLTHTNLGGGQIQAILTLAPFSPNITGQSSFTNDVALTNKEVLKVTFDGSDDQLRLRFRHRRQRALTWQTAVDSYNGFLQVSSAREVLQERPLRKGDVAAICLSAGRVTPAMLRVHAEELWNVEQQLSTNAAAASSIPVDVYQGSLLYLMGMNYFQRTEPFNEINSRLNKVQKISWFGMGLAKLSPRRNADGSLYGSDIDPIWPSVDMFYRQLTAVANGGVHLNSAGTQDLVQKNYVIMGITDESAQEHAILNQFFGQNAAVSTVKVLQLAQSKVATGGPSVVELNFLNWETEGDVLYNGIALRDYDPSMWQEVTSFLNDSIFSIGWISPGAQITPSGSFSGMVALLYSPTVLEAIIGDQNGAYGDPLSYRTISQDNTLFYDVQLDSQGNYSFNGNLLLPGSAFSEVNSTFRLSSLENGLANDDYVFNPYQLQLAGAAGLALDGQPLPFSQSYVNVVDNGGLIHPDDREGNGIYGVVAEPVNTMTGEFYVDEVDLSLPGPMPLQVRRNYGSQNLADNQLGYGWKLNYMPFLTVAMTNTVVYEAEADGSVLAFGSLASNLWAPTLALNPTLNNDSANGIGSVANKLNARLAKITTNSANYYFLTNGDGSLRVFQEMSFPLTNSPSLDRLRPYLTTWYDNRSNYYRFEYGTNVAQADYGQVRRIVSSSGNVVRFEYDVYGHVVNVFSLDGRQVQYDYNSHGDLVTVTRPDMSEVTYEYQVLNWVTNSMTNAYSTHLLVREDKPDGRVLQNDYDDQRRVTNQWATVGLDLRLVRNATFRYTNNFNLTNISATLNGVTVVYDFTNNPTSYFYTNSLIRRIRDPLGAETVQAWYEASETNAPAYPRSLKTVSDKRGLVTTFLYDSQGNVTNTTMRGDLLGDGNTNTTVTTLAAYNANNLPLSTVDARGTTNLFFYTNTWLLARQETWPANATSASQAAVTLYTYTTVTNPADGTVAFGLRSQQVKAAGSPDAATTAWTYNSHGFPTFLTRYTGTADPAVTTSNLYNSRGELVRQTDAAGRTTAFGFDPLGHPQSREVFESGQPIPMSWDYLYYNENGELTWSDGPRYNPEDYVWRDYDGGGRKIQEIHWRSEAKADGTGVEAPAGDALYATTFYQYDAFGNLTQATDPLGNYSLKRYDAVGRLLREEFYDASGVLLATNGFVYNAAGDVTNTFNALGGSMQKKYTSTGKPKFQRNADGSTNAWRYYADGRLRREIQRNGAYWESVYDDASRLVTRTFYSATGISLATNVSKFDRRGNLVERTDEAGNTFTNIYDGLDRVKITAGPATVTVDALGFDPENPTGYVTNTSQQFTTWTYDAAGETLTTANALGEKTITTSDALGRITHREIRDAQDAVVRQTTNAYSADHQAVTVTDGSGSSAIAKTAYTDNDGHTVLSVGYPDSGVLQFSLSQYDLAGNLVHQELDSSTNGSFVNWTTKSYVYDGLNRLVSKTDRDNALTTYAYDALGDLTRRTMPGGLQWVAGYNPAGQMLTETNIGAGGVITRTNGYAYYGAGSPFAGLLQAHANGKGDVCTYYYDDFLRKSSNSCVWIAPDTMSHSWTYDARGLLIKTYEYFNNSAGYGVERSYDSYGQLINETLDVGDGPYSAYASIDLGWDSAGRRTKLTFETWNPRFVEYYYGWQADGRLASVNTPIGSASYDYDDAGQLISRTVGNRVTSVTSRDGTGRPLAISTTVNTLTNLNETLTWTGDGLLSSHTLVRGDFTDLRSYSYVPASRRLLEERLNLDATTRWTNTFAYDGGVPAGPGVLTKMGRGTGVSNVWSGSVDAFSRVNSETNLATTLPAWGRVNSANATINALLDGHPVPVYKVNYSYSGQATNQWRSALELMPGAHQLTVSATHPSGQFWTNASIWFTNNSSGLIAADAYDAVGNVTQRVWRASSGATNHVQNIFWDGLNRLTMVTDFDSQTNGYQWRAIYDSLNRQVGSFFYLVTNGVTATDQINVSYHDPLYEFLELGTDVEGWQTWRIYGPDLDGRYGSLNGVGGLDAVSTDPVTFSPVVSDVRGNVLGVVTNNGTVLWNASRPTGYGAVPGYRPLTIAKDVPLVQSIAWRGRWSDVMGWVNLGARYYDPVSGKFLNADPMGHEASPSLYDFCGGDPINYFDADGRLAKGGVQMTSELLTGLWNLADNVAGTVAYDLTSPFAPEWAEQNYGADLEGLGNTLIGTKNLGADALGSLAYMGVGAYSFDIADEYFGQSAFRTMQAMDAMTGGYDNPLGYRLGYSGFGLLLAGETTQLSRWARGSEVADVGAQTTRLTETAETVARNPNVYEAFFESPISGTSRTAHRTSANEFLANQLRSDPQLNSMFNQQFGANVLEHMESGSSGLLNPSGTVWHHPFDNPNVMQLLQGSEHIAPSLQSVLHPGGVGGFGNFYGL